MTVGVPGAGIGGLFYLANALTLPVRGLIRRVRGESVCWRTTWGQAGLALGILAGIWAAGWLVGLWLGPAVPHAARAGLAVGSARTARLLGAATVLFSFLTLGAVLLSVQMARVTLRRRD